VELGAIRTGGSKSIILKDEHIDTLADSLPKMLLSVCIGRGTGAGCVSCALRLSPPKIFLVDKTISARSTLTKYTGPARWIVSHSATTIVAFYYRFAGRTVVCDIVDNFSDVCWTYA